MIGPLLAFTIVEKDYMNFAVKEYLIIMLYLFNLLKRILNYLRVCSMARSLYIKSKNKIQNTKLRPNLSVPDASKAILINLVIH